MSRLEQFDRYASHPWFGRLYGRLRASERELAREFIARNDGLDATEFERAVNRMFLDREKPKNWTIVTELLVSTNAAVAALGRVTAS